MATGSHTLTGQEAPVSEMPELHPVFARQIQALMTKDFDSLMETYHPDIVSMQFQGPIRGRQASRELLTKYQSLSPEFVTVNEYVHNEDMIMTRTTMRVKGEEVVAFGAYVIKDGMIWRQFGCDEGGVRDWWA
ncbi:MAG: nuclear transport factor 2 family protein [Actinobacteria bacterium]|nr:nuclear transport factor 2 family protein [Actinomycetota bacterium]